jgi:hypothetical protein
MTASARVLVADVPIMDEKIRECLPGHDLTFVPTLYEAISHRPGVRRIAHV